MALFDRVVDENLLVRRMYVVANNVLPEARAKKEIAAAEQLDLFSLAEAAEPSPADPEREKRRQEAVLAIRQRYGKNAILKGMNLEEGATAMERNAQIGGHRA